MPTSDSSDDGVTTSLLGKRTASPPAAMRSSKSVLSQVRDTLFSFMKRSKLDDATNKDKENRPDKDSRSTISASEKQRSLEAFTDRIKSFTVQNWMGIPLCLSPPLLAQYGWQCIGIDTIKCCSCRAVLSIRLPWPSEENYRLQCYKYRQKVLTGHMKICSWPSYPCPDLFVAPFLHGVQGIPEVIIEFIERRTNLLELKNKLPKIDPGFLKEINSDRIDVKTLASVNGSALEPPPVSSKSADDYFADFSEIETASLLAMCGWDTEHSSESRLPALFCKSSGRIIVLHNFFALDEAVDPADSDSNEECGTSKLIDCDSGDVSGTFASYHETSRDGKISQYPLKRKRQFFHPLNQHCPWSHWIVALNPISSEEFRGDDDCDVVNPSSEMYQHVINPLIPDAKPGWYMVMNALLGRKGDGEKTNSPAVNASSPSEQGQTGNEVGNEDGRSDTSKTPTKSAVAHARQLLKEWSSPK